MLTNQPSDPAGSHRPSPQPSHGRCSLSSRDRCCTVGVDAPACRTRPWHAASAHATESPANNVCADGRLSDQTTDRGDVARLRASCRAAQRGVGRVLVHRFPCRGRGERGGPSRAEGSRVRDGRAHATLVFDGERCVGWCQFGSPEELPRIKSRARLPRDPRDLPEWRITCFFVDKEYRHKGVAAAALNGALQEIGRLGGGTVESSPEDVEGRKVSNSFLYNATLSMFEQEGFTPVRQLGKNNWLVSKKVRARRVSV